MVSTNSKRQEKLGWAQGNRHSGFINTEVLKDCYWSSNQAACLAYARAYLETSSQRPRNGQYPKGVHIPVCSELARVS